MTKPTITYGHGHLEDCDDTTGWTEARTNMLDADATLECLYNDMFKITAVFDEGATDEKCRYSKNFTGISPTTYDKYMVRYKTSHSSAGAQARVILAFTDTETEEILAPSYSTTWKVKTGSITKSDSTINGIRLYADDDGTDGTFYVYYDFVLLHKGTFTFPQVRPGGVKLEIPRKDAEIDIWGRDGGIHQKGGMKSPVITLTGDMDYVDDDDVAKSGTTWGTTYYKYGEYLLKIIRDSDPWQWFTSDIINCKATPDNNAFSIEQKSDSEGAQRVWQLRLKQYSKSSLGESTWDDRAWYGY